MLIVITVSNIWRKKNIVICHLEILHYHLFSGFIAIAIEIANYMYSCQVLIVLVLA